FSVVGSASSPDSILRIPHYGGLWAPNDGTGLVRIIHQFQEPPRTEPPAALVLVSKFSAPVDRDFDRMVHGRSGASAVDGVRGPADGRRDDAVPHYPRSIDFARCVLLLLQLYLWLWRLLHLPVATRRTRGTLGQAARCGDPKPPFVGS